VEGWLSAAAVPNMCGVSELRDLIDVSGGNHGQPGMVTGLGAQPE
jgi:hypothetical protein